MRFNRVTLKQPRNRPVTPDVPVRQPIYIVEAKEVDPPEGVPPAHWRLLTSHRVESFEQARRITQLYRRRWVIEKLFRTIKKKGFDIENVSMETKPFKTLCAMTPVAGVSSMQLVQGRDGQGKRPLEDVFDLEDQPALEAVSASLEGTTAKQKTHIRKARLLLQHGFVPALVVGLVTTVNQALWLCCVGYINSGLYNSGTESIKMCESSRLKEAHSRKGGGERPNQAPMQDHRTYPDPMGGCSETGEG